jgi:uncharacterized membrane protein
MDQDPSQIPEEPSEERSHALGALAYFFLALSGLVLLAVKRDDPFVRFHALQSVLATVAFFFAGLVLRALGWFPVFGFLYLYLYKLYLILVFVYWLFLIVRAYRGDRYKIPYLGDVAERQVG